MSMNFARVVWRSCLAGGTAAKAVPALGEQDAQTKLTRLIASAAPVKGEVLRDVRLRCLQCLVRTRPRRCAVLSIAKQKSKYDLSVAYSI